MKWIQQPTFQATRIEFYIRPYWFFLLFILFASSFLKTESAFAQGVIPSKGTDFWVGFPYAPAFSSSGTSQRTELFVTSNVSTTGVVKIPKQGYSQPFLVTANQTTTISLPIALVENVGSEVVENRGVEVVTQDTVSVFAITFQDYSADATVVYPKQTLGTRYRISSYPGLNSVNPRLSSELLVVATEDGTQVRITPSCPTLQGHNTANPIVVNLDAGESYQVFASIYQYDLSGTKIEATDSSGECRPFAVFSGTTCTNIPTGCSACDILYEQSLPISNWGKVFYMVPFSFATRYTYRVMADQNNTTYFVNGILQPTLNAGQFKEFNAVNGTVCVASGQPVSVIQYMEGASCAGQGDPSMMYINAEEQKIDDVTFSTVTSTVITQHAVNVIMNTNHIAQLKLDGVLVPASKFTTMNYCTNMSYARLPLTQGSHHLEADSGFTAYVYGAGGFESYAYSVGSFNKKAAAKIDSLVCGADTIYLHGPANMFSYWWSTATNPTDTIGTARDLMLTVPIQPDVYILHGNEYISGCSKEVYYNVEVPTAPTLTLADSITSCINQQLQLSVQVTPAASNYEYLWTPSTGLSNPAIANPVLLVSSSGWYKVRVRGMNGCTPAVYDSVYINALNIPLPSVSSSANQLICKGDSITLRVQGGISCLWTPGNFTTDSITVKPLVSTNYIVFVSDSNGCYNRDTVLVVVAPLPAVSCGFDRQICFGENALLSATGAISYAWSPGGFTSAQAITSPPVTTTYVVIGTDANGCVNSDTLNVIVKPLPPANAGPDRTICSGFNTTLVGSGGVQYFWNPVGVYTKQITVAPQVTTSYYLTVTDSNGCKAKDTVVVKIDPYLSGTQKKFAICMGDSIRVGGSSGASYNWLPGGQQDSSIVVSPVTNSTYTVHIITSVGCLIYDTMQVKVNPLPLATIDRGRTVCLGDTVVLHGGGGGSYSWLPGGQTTANITFTPASTTPIILTVVDSNSCRNSDTVQVTVNSLPPAEAGADQHICIGKPATLIASGGITYDWLQVGSGANVTVYPQTDTQYNVVVTDINGCSNQDSLTVFVSPTPTVGFVTLAPRCINQDIAFINLSDSTGIHVWDFGDNSGSSDYSPVHRYSKEGAMLARLYIENQYGCFADTQQLVYVNVLPEPAFSVENSCLNVSALFRNQSRIAMGSIAGWQWDFGDGNASTDQEPEHRYQLPGNYQIHLSATSDSGCSSTYNGPTELTIYPLPVPRFSSSPNAISVFTPTIYFSNLTVGGVKWYWDFGDGKGNSTQYHSSYIYADTGHYQVLLAVTDVHGCIDSNYQEIYIIPELTVYVPNSFTPNNDLKNDVFEVLGEGIQMATLYIYNRFGQLVFQQQDPRPVWDGKASDGSQCMEGVYAYHLELTDFNGHPSKRDGTVRIIR